MCAGNNLNYFYWSKYIGTIDILQGILLNLLEKVKQNTNRVTIISIEIENNMRIIPVVSQIFNYLH